MHLDFIVLNMDEGVARLMALGASLDRDIKLREYGRIANMADPFGNGFDLISAAEARLYLCLSTARPSAVHELICSC